MTTRSRLFTLLAILATLALAVAGVGCGVDDVTGGGGSSKEAKELLEKSFKKQVTSANVSLDVEATLDGIDGLSGPLKLKLKGPYAQESPTAFPTLDWEVTASGAGQELAAGVIVTEDNAYVEYKGQAYEVGAEAFAELKSQQEESATAFTPQGLKKLGIDPATWLKDANVKDGDDIGGDSTQLITGDVDVRKVIEDLIELSKSDAFQQQLRSQGQEPPEIPDPSEADLKKIEDAIKKLKVEFNVDEQDNLRRTAIDTDFVVPEGALGELKGGSFTFDFTLDEIDPDLNIEAPANPRPLSELQGQSGLGL